VGSRWRRRVNSGDRTFDDWTDMDMDMMDMDMDLDVEKAEKVTPKVKPKVKPKKPKATLI